MEALIHHKIPHGNIPLAETILFPFYLPSSSKNRKFTFAVHVTLKYANLKKIKSLICIANYTFVTRALEAQIFIDFALYL